jgi:hypothetical protein
VKLTYSNCTDFIKTELGRPGWFRTNSGVREENVLSPVLFSAMMDEIANKIRG